MRFAKKCSGLNYRFFIVLILRIGQSDAFIGLTCSNPLITSARPATRTVRILALPLRPKNNEITKALCLLKMPNSDSERMKDINLFSGLFVILSSIFIHLDGWMRFLSSLAEMMANSVSQPDEFTSAISFWLFGVFIHPILKPIFRISEVLHASPGPKVAGLIPFSFLAGSAVVAYTLVKIDRLRNALGVVILASFLNFVGTGLDGQTPSLLADYNIQFDDNYNGGVVKGCPNPDTVQLSTVNENFDYKKYQGRWYWHEVHDWTQFREMYDTTLDIRLTGDGNGYVNTLKIKGPSPTNSPLSWDKSPLINGARYSWTGIIDNSGPPGVSQESGFGVVFPNYIVDVQMNEGGNDYQELIQFQCIEVGGVRLYEGIDFMSRSPTMTDEQLRSMHRRAHEAGLDPYGAAPEQMHRIERASTRSTWEQNEWQLLWKRLNVARYLDQSLD